MELYKLIWCVVSDLLTLCWFVICQHLRVDLNKCWRVQSDWCECWLLAFSLVMEKLRERLNAPYQKTRPYLETQTPDRQPMVKLSKLITIALVLLWSSALELLNFDLHTSWNCDWHFDCPSILFHPICEVTEFFVIPFSFSFCSSYFLSTDVCSWWCRYQ